LSFVFFLKLTKLVGIAKFIENLPLIYNETDSKRKIRCNGDG